MRPRSSKKAPAVKPHGWEDHAGLGGKPPFKGAAPPIHKQQGGKFVRKAKTK